MARTPKRDPGEWLRERLLLRVLEGGTLTMWGIGWLLGGLFSVVFASWLMAFVPAIAFIALGAWRLFRGWRLGDVRKGARAEEKVGEAIEYALVRSTCAVAHGVTEIARAGDIDHLVATPGGLWVVETKSGGKARRYLKRIARNVEAVREWAPPGVDVTGVLVFAGDAPVEMKHSYERGTETILCFPDADALMGHLQMEASAAVSLESGVVPEVWRLANRPVDGKLEAESAADGTRAEWDRVGA